MFKIVYSVVAKTLGSRLKIKFRWLKESEKLPCVVGGSACCALPSDHRPKIQPVIAFFSAGEFRQQPAVSDNTEYIYH